MSENKSAAAVKDEQSAGFDTKESLKEFLLNIRDKMAERIGAPVYALSALNYIMNSPRVYELFDNESKEIARDIWLRLKQAGFQLKDPPLLFEEDEPAVDVAQADK